MSSASSNKKASAPPPPAAMSKDIYLMQYNAFCCLGWAYVLALGIPTLFQSIVASKSSSGTSYIEALKIAGGELYFATPATAGLAKESSPSLATMLTFVQCAAMLEIVHAAVGLVRSPVFVTMMQVGSRIVALHMVTHSPKAQSKPIKFVITHFGNTLLFFYSSPSGSTLGSGSHDFIMGPRRGSSIPLLCCCTCHGRCYQGNTIPAILASLFPLCHSVPHWHCRRTIRLHQLVQG